MVAPPTSASRARSGRPLMRPLRVEERLTAWATVDLWSLWPTIGIWLRAASRRCPLTANLVTEGANGRERTPPGAVLAGTFGGDVPASTWPRVCGTRSRGTLGAVDRSRSRTRRSALSRRLRAASGLGEVRPNGRATRRWQTFGSSPEVRSAYDDPSLGRSSTAGRSFSSEAC